MKNQKQLIKEIEKINNLFTIQQGALNFNVGEIINIVVSACEETIKESPEWAFENLKKLKSK